MGLARATPCLDDEVFSFKVIAFERFDGAFLWRIWDLGRHIRVYNSVQNMQFIIPID